jgi:hypothetical protein
MGEDMETQAETMTALEIAAEAWITEALAEAVGGDPDSPFVKGQAATLRTIADYLRFPTESLVEWIYSDDAREHHWSVGAFRDYVEEQP